MTMSLRSPTRDGFRALVSHPWAGLIELGWRWSFGAAFSLLLVFCLFAYLQTLPVTNGQILLLGSGQTVLILQTLQRILQGSAPRLVRALAVLGLAFIVGWVFWASAGRVLTLKILLGKDSPPDKEAGKIRFMAIAGLNFLRAFTLVLSGLLCLNVLFLLAGADASDPSWGGAALLCILLLLVVLSAWWAWNWLLSLAQVFVALEGCGTFESIMRALELCKTRTGGIVAISFWFCLARVVAFYAAGMFSFLFIAVAPYGTAGLVASMGSCALAYLLLADFLYVGRLAGYIALAASPGEPSESPELLGEKPPWSGEGPPTRVDPGELILSDVPLS